MKKLTIIQAIEVSDDKKSCSQMCAFIRSGCECDLFGILLPDGKDGWLRDIVCLQKTIFATAEDE